ncbi:MAG: hypothetical protein R3C15_21660 [Thermoleophilia bacterium]
MSGWTRRLRVSPAMVVALIALFVALSGGAYAGFVLPNNSVRTATIANGQVKTADLGAAAVTTAKLRNGAVTSTKLADRAVTSAKLADGAVLSTKLAEGAVTTSRIAEAAITGAKLSDSAITEPKLADGAVSAAKIAPNAVTGAKIVDGSVTDADLAAGISGSKISGKVPQATQADSAATAGSVNGMTVHRVDWRTDLVAPSVPATTILEVGGLRLDGSCNNVNPSVIAYSAVDDAMIHTAGIRTDTQAPHADADEDFDVATTNYALYPIAGVPGPTVGTTVYSTPTGGIVELTWRFEGSVTSPNCRFHAIATHSPAP